MDAHSISTLIGAGALLAAVRRDNQEAGDWLAIAYDEAREEGHVGDIVHIVADTFGALAPAQARLVMWAMSLVCCEEGTEEAKQVRRGYAGALADMA